MAFGFRAASTADAGSIPELAGLADLDLMQARRHARFLAGHELSADLRALREAAPGRATRGLAAVAAGWADRQAHAAGHRHHGRRRRPAWMTWQHRRRSRHRAPHDLRQHDRARPGR